MSEMVERVTLALNGELRRQMAGGPAPGREWDSASWTAKSGVIDLDALTRVAIEAMREPTAELRELFDRDQFCGDGQLERDWPDIIDALLKPEPALTDEPDRAI